jgi:hypothetical protein
MDDNLLIEKFPDIYNIFKNRNCKLVYFDKKTIKLKYICCCGIEKEKLYKDFMKNKECRTCKEKKLKEKPLEDDYIDSENGEIWKPIIGGWISNFGNAKNALGKNLTLCPTKYRYHINGKNQYASRLVAEAFQIENWEKLNDENYVVSHLDTDIKNNNINNLKILTKNNIQSNNGKKSRHSDLFQEKINWTMDRFKEIECQKIKEMPKHLFYKNGEIWNGNRFLVFSKSEKYLQLCTDVKNYKVHRLICYAFHPIEGKTQLNDYDGLQVNHIDGNTLNNHADNLEWVTKSENINHSYNKNLNKKVRNVLQYSLKDEFIAEYKSISQASKETGEPEHRIREISKGKKNSKAQFKWKFKNTEETGEYSKKYSVKT